MIYSCLWIDHRHLLSIWAHVFLCQHLCDASCTTTHCYALQHTAMHCNIVCETSKISVSQREIGYAYCCIFFTTSAGQAGKCGELSKIIQSTCSHLSACLLASTHVRRVMYDNTLQHTATHCNTASYCNVLHYSAPRRRRGAVLQRVKSRMEYPETPYREAPIPLPSGVNLTRPKPGPSTASWSSATVSASSGRAFAFQGGSCTFTEPTARVSGICAGIRLDSSTDIGSGPCMRAAGSSCMQSQGPRLLSWRGLVWLELRLFAAISFTGIYMGGMTRALWHQVLPSFSGLVSTRETRRWWCLS